MVDQNLKELTANSSAYDWSILDKNSIMIYASDYHFLKSGKKSKCWFHENYTLSKLDIEGIERAYQRTNGPLSLEIQSKSLPVALQLKLDPNFRRALERQLELTNKLIEK